MITVLTGGTFDLFHAGHVELLKYSASIGNRLVVALNKDSFVKRFKGKNPIMNFNERAEVVAACRYVDGVVPNLMDEDFSAVIEMVRPEIITIGSDWADRNYMGQLGKRAEMLIRDLKISVVYVPRPNPPLISSTEIKRRILEQDRVVLMSSDPFGLLRSH